MAEETGSKCRWTEERTGGEPEVCSYRCNSRLVGRWHRVRPMLDTGVSSVLSIYMLVLTAMLEFCLLLSFKHAPCMPSSVWPSWQLPFKFASFSPCYMLDCMYFISIFPHACFSYDVLCGMLA